MVFKLRNLISTSELERVFCDFSLITCPSCGVIKTKITKKIKGKGQEMYEDIRVVEKHFKEQGSQFQKYAKDFLTNLPVRSGKLLDVGCGFGWVVKEAKERGFKAEGIDISKAFINLGRKKLHVNIQTQSLEKMPMGHKFDVITLNHVLEHIEKPVEFLKLARKHCVVGGYILVACPNIRSLMYLIFRERWYGLQPRQHFWQFTPDSLSNILKKSGWSVEKVLVNDLDYDLKNWKKYIFNLILFSAKLFNLGDQVIVLANNQP